MFQIILATKEDGEASKLVTFLNVNVEVIKSKVDRSVITLVNMFDDSPLGYLKVLPGKVIIEVDETTAEGEHFWREFVKSYPDLNPFDSFWGVVYPAATGKEGVYDLVVGSSESLATDEDLNLATHYAKFKYAYFVKFFRGNWRPGENVEVTLHAQIKPNGRLGSEQYRDDFNLVK